MGRLVVLRSLYRSAFHRSYRFATATVGDNHRLQLRYGLPHSSPSRSLFHLASCTTPPTSECRAHFALRIGSIRSFSEDVTHLPNIRDAEILKAFKELMAASWDELPPDVIYDAKKALSKSTADKAGQEALANVFRAAEAVEEFDGVIVSFRLEIDRTLGLLGENVKPLSDEYANALRAIYKKYTTYLDAFGPEETYLKKKVETELGTKMIQLKLRCGGLDSEWGKVTVLGTSGLSGSYIEHRGH